jgi:hypothetical protein
VGRIVKRGRIKSKKKEAHNNTKKKKEFYARVLRMVKRNSTTSAIKTTTAKYGEDFDSLIGIYLNNHDRKNQASGRSPNSKGSQSYSASSSSNSILYNQTQMSELIVKQLNEKDSTLMKALRLVNDQRQRTGNSSGPYSYIPGSYLVLYRYL